MYGAELAMGLNRVFPHQTPLELFEHGKHWSQVLEFLRMGHSDL